MLGKQNRVFYKLITVLVCPGIRETEQGFLQTNNIASVSWDLYIKSYVELF